MRYKSHTHRSGETLLHTDYPEASKDIDYAISSITDEDIIKQHQAKHPTQKSLSMALNDLLRDRFVAAGWEKESPIFAEKEYQKTDKGRKDGVWRLDFAKPDASVSIEVCFNHGEALAWNLLKPVLAGEQNHVTKAIDTKLGVLILATQGLKGAGGFDGAVATYEKAIQYLIPLQSQLTVPLVLIGLEAPMTFRMEHVLVDKKKHGKIQRFFL
jgi:hypothetical protein